MGELHVEIFDLPSFPPPMGRRAILMMPKGQRPHPRRIYRRGGGLNDAADNDAVGEYVEIVILPFAG
jgi:hypothetical protein